MNQPRPPFGEWIASYPAEIMVCDAAGTILEMSDLAIHLYQQEGGAALIGANVFEHHPGYALANMKQVVDQQRHVIYTTEKGGHKKLVSIAPWYRAGAYAGFALFVLDLPEQLSNIIKD